MQKIFNLIEKNKNTFIFFILLTVVFLIYGQSLSYDPVGLDDDVLITDNYDYLSNYKNIPLFFSKSVYNKNDVNDLYYRPVLILSFSLDSIFLRNNFKGYHFTNITLHAIAAFLIFLFLSRLNFDKIYVYIFTLIYAVHPAFAQAVAWIPGRNDTLLTIFCISALIFLSDYLLSKNKKIYKLFFFFLFYALSLFVKESAVVMFVVVPLFMLLVCEEKSKKNYTRIVLPVILITFGYMLAESLVIKGTAKSIDIISVIKNVFSSLNMYLYYIERVLFPFRLRMVVDSFKIDFFCVISCLVFALPLIAAFVFKTGRKNVVLFGFIWFILFILPTFAIPNPLLTHRLHTSSVGVFIMFIEFFTCLSFKFKPCRKYLLCVLCACALIFPFISYFQQKKFENKKIFLERASEEQFVSWAISIKAADYYLGLNMIDKVRDEMKKITTYPGNATIGYLRISGYLYAYDGNFDKAVEYFNRVLHFMPSDNFSIFFLSEIYFLEEKYDKASEYAEKLIKLSPDNKKFQLQYEKIKTLAVRKENN